MGWIFLGLTISTEVGGSLALKYSDGFTKLWPSIIALACYGGTLFFMSLAYKHLSMGMTYALWSGIGLILVTTIGIILFGESLSIQKVLFTGLIVAGVMGLRLTT